MSSQRDDLGPCLFTNFKLKYLEFRWFDFRNFCKNVKTNVFTLNLLEWSPWSPGSFRDIRH